MRQASKSISGLKKSKQDNQQYICTSDIKFSYTEKHVQNMHITTYNTETYDTY